MYFEKVECVYVPNDKPVINLIFFHKGVRMSILLSRFILSISLTHSKILG